ncbi:MAG: hypothetical protein KF774_02380 [Planctomyces sp.]|nr:hypothetical protein [Planctomyces sp.]
MATKPLPEDAEERFQLSRACDIERAKWEMALDAILVRTRERKTEFDRRRELHEKAVAAWKALEANPVEKPVFEPRPLEVPPDFSQPWRPLVKTGPLKDYLEFREHEELLGALCNQFDALDVSGVEAAFKDLVGMLDRLQQRLDAPPASGPAAGAGELRLADRLRDSGIQRRPLALIRFCDGKRTVRLSELSPGIWPDAPGIGAVKTALHRANNALVRIGHAKTLSLRGAEIVWV